MSKCFNNNFHLFNVIGKAGKGKASDDEDEDEETKFSCTLTQRVNY